MAATSLAHIGKYAVLPERNPKLRCSTRHGQAEVGRHNSHDGDRMLVERYGSSHESGIGAKSRAPQRFAHHYYGIRIDRVIGRLQGPAEQGFYAQHVEVVRRHRASLNVTWLALPAQRQ